MPYMVLIAGFGGGVTRGLVGFIKHQYAYKNVGFKLPYFFGMIFLSGVVGLLTSMIFNNNPLFAFIVGYAGGDFIENAYKIAFKKGSIYPVVPKI
jgi:hypothetical protein